MPVPDAPYSGAGTLLGVKIPPASSFTSVANVIELAPPKVSIDKIDTTVLISTAMTSIPSIPDNGEVTLSLMYIVVDPGVAMLLPLTVTPALVHWLITLPDGTPSVGTGSRTTTGTTIAFDGFISGWEPKGFAIGDKATADVTITVSGAVTITPAT